MMSTPAYREFLTTNKIELIDLLLDVVRADKIHVKYNRDLVVEEFFHIVDRRIQKYIDKVEAPKEQDEEFDPRKSFVHAFRMNLYRFVLGEVFGKIKNNQARFVSLDDIDQLEDAYQAEEDAMQSIFMESLRSAFNDFASKANSLDVQVMKLRMGGASDEQMAASLFPGQNFDVSLRNKVRYIYNIVQFRYACFLATKKIFDTDHIIKSFNKETKLVKRFFGAEKLDSVPDTDLLLLIAFNKEEKRKKADQPSYSANKTVKKVSKIDFNGKKHDHCVVYDINGRLYDQVTKEWRART